MGQRTSYPPGTFSWVDLATHDLAAATAFYTTLFGWETEQGDAGRGSLYTTNRVDGDAVSGLLEMPERMRAAGVRPSWTSYITVADADAVAARTTELGGRVVEAASEVGGAGRTAVLEDPLGAVFAVWQPLGGIGAERVNDVGCLCMNEYVTSDVEAACGFYEALLGWTTESFVSDPDGRPQMVLARNGERVNASVLAAPEGTPAHWRPCFTVKSTEAAVARVRELGGSELISPFDIPDGSLAVVRDPEGAHFSVFAGDIDP